MQFFFQMGFYSFLKSYKKRFINSLIMSDFNEEKKEDYHSSLLKGVEIQIPYQTYASNYLVIFDQSATNIDLNRFTSIYLSKGLNPYWKNFKNNLDMNKEEFIKLVKHQTQSSLWDEPLTLGVRSLYEKNAINIQGPWLRRTILEFDQI